MIDVSASGHYVGDCRDLLKRLPAACVQTCVTSPPYWGLRDYGHADQIGLEATPEEYVAAIVAVFRDVRRVLRDDGTLWLNLGDSYIGAPGGWLPIRGICCHCAKLAWVTALRQVVLPNGRRVVEEWCLACAERECVAIEEDE